MSNILRVRGTRRAALTACAMFSGGAALAALQTGSAPYQLAVMPKPTAPASPALKMNPALVPKAILPTQPHYTVPTAPVSAPKSALVAPGPAPMIPGQTYINRPTGPSYPAQKDVYGSYYVVPKVPAPASPGTAMSGAGTTTQPQVINQTVRVGPQLSAPGVAANWAKNNPEAIVSAGSMFLPGGGIVRAGQTAERVIAPTIKTLIPYVESRAGMLVGEKGAPKVIIGPAADKPKQLWDAERMVKQYGSSPSDYNKISGPAVKYPGGGSIEVHGVWNKATGQIVEIDSFGKALNRGLPKP